MKALPLAFGLLLTATLHAHVLSLQQLEPRTNAEFEGYVGRWQTGPGATFQSTGKLWLDEQSQAVRKTFDAGAEALDVVYSANIKGGHIHHMFGAMRIPNTKLETVLHTMENYAKYPLFFKPDVVYSRATRLGDSDEKDHHFHIEMELDEPTLWTDLVLEGTYDAHYRKLDDKRVTTVSRSLCIREFKESRNRAQGTYPEGQDHGLLWRTFTFWHLRERDGGVDMEVNSISLTRQIPLGFGWWATRKARETIDKMMSRTRAAVASAAKS